MLYSDSPIKDLGEDYLQQEKFVNRLKSVITDYNSQDSLTIQLRGEWGSGKSSVLNMLKNSLEEDSEKGPLVMYFNPWNFSTKNELIKSFFKELSVIFKENMGDEEFSKLNDFLNLIMSSVVSLTPIFGADSFFSIIANIFSNILIWISKRSVDEKNLVDVKNKLNSLLIKNNRKIVVIVDDIDRLTNIEIEQVFQLTKSIADFSNMIYILAYDEKYAITALENNGIHQPKEYIKKINQLQLDIPKANKLNLKEIFFERISEIFKKNHLNFDYYIIEDIYYSYLTNYFSTIRDINRYLNTLSFYLPLIKERVYINDFLRLTILQVFEYDIYLKIKNNPEMFVESYDFDYLISNHIPSIYYVHEKKAKEFYEELYKLADNEEIVKKILYGLFPKLLYLEQNDKFKFKFNDSEYITDFRIASSRSFNYYFTFNNIDNIILDEEFEHIIHNLSSSTFKETIDYLKRNNNLLSFLDHLHLYNSIFSNKKIQSYINIFLYYGDSFYCDDKTLSYNLQVSLKLSRFISILLYNLEESSYSNFSFNELKNSLEMSDSLFLVMFIIYYFSAEKDREITIFEDYHYDIEFEEVNILKQIAVKKIIEITKSGNWEKVKNLNYVIYTYNLLIGDEYDDSFSFIISEYSSEENLIKLIKSLLLIENIDENSDLNWEILNKYLDTSYIWIIFKEHKENNSVFYRKNSLLIDQFLLNVFS